MSSMPTLIGMVVGVACSIGLAAAGFGKVVGFHAGLIALLVNGAIAVGGSLIMPDAQHGTCDQRPLADAT